MPLTRTETRKQVTSIVLASFFEIDRIGINKQINRGNRLDLIYLVLKRRDLTDEQKRKHIMSTSLTEYYKGKSWRLYLDNNRQVS